MVSESRLAEFLTTNHLLYFVIAVAALQAIHALKAVFHLLKSGVKELFEFFSFFHGCIYELKGDAAEHRSKYQQRLRELS